MPKSHPPYPPEFRRQMVRLVKSGRVTQEFEPTAQAVRNGVQQADRDEGLRQDGLTTDEREELNRLRRENRQLKDEAEIEDLGEFETLSCLMCSSHIYLD
jgi:transposase